uniref:Secreted protein n=1 Tax=Streptomyces sp. NBC_00003 TaxID=2903608 RepID=A0AAU2UVZ7_9ACTN
MAGVAVALPLAHAAGPEAGKAANASTAEMPFAVETFDYPNAETVLNERKITLKRGDGNITLKPGNGQEGYAGCTASNNIWIESRVDKKGFCFVAKAKSGYLTMEVADAYAIWTEDHSVRAKLTTEGKTTTVDAPKNDTTQVGESNVPGGRKRSVLVELRVTG